jgi:hypothetical protein
MRIGLCIVDIYIPGKSSLKGKRQVLRSIKDKIKNRFNFSLAELDDQNKWQRTKLGIVTISNDGRHANNTLTGVMNFIHSFGDIHVLDYDIQLM